LMSRIRILSRALLAERRSTSRTTFTWNGGESPLREDGKKGVIKNEQTQSSSDDDMICPQSETKTDK
jgi:hypothetical protein